MRLRRQKSVKPEPGLEPHPVERLMMLAEQMQDLSNRVLLTADEVRQEIRKNEEQ